MKPADFHWKFRLAETIPVLIALPCAVYFFIQAIPSAAEHVWFYVNISIALFLVTRIPNEWYLRRHLLPPVFRYLRAVGEGRPLSRGDLAAYYRDFANLVPRCQVQAFLLWCLAGIGFVSGSLIWIPEHRNVVQVVALIVAILLTMILSLLFSYLTFKRIVRPLIVDVMRSMDTLPAGGILRIPFRLKIGLTTISLVILGFLVLGLIISNHVANRMNAYALDLAEKEYAELSGLLSLAYETEYDMLLADWSVGSQIFVLVDGEGRRIGKANEGSYTRAHEVSVREALRRTETPEEVFTTDGIVRIRGVSKDLFLLQMVSLEPIQSVRRNTLLSILLFAGILSVVVGFYILWMTRDTAWILEQACDYNKRLAEGDLTKTPAIWSDDEMGTMADSLRLTFLGLARMAKEVFRAAGIVEEEVHRVVGTAKNLHQEVANQASSVEQTTGSVKSLEKAITQVSGAMEKVADATQEMSSTILEMQASVEEIAANAEVLIQSVESTVSSSNEITASSDQIQGSTDKLQQNSQEAVSFLTQLDAALDETQRNAQSLSEASTKVTRDAEDGFSAVATVEEQILRTRSASEESKEALRGLTEALERIGKIVGVIQEITEQTNLLSLNASIIAAGAGEYGKSFAVVATQIRELSSKTAGNAKEIRAVIQSIRSSGENISAAIDKTFEVADRGATLSKGAGESLKTILESSAAQEEMSKRIASATSELAHGGRSASRTMHDIFTMIQWIGKASDEQAQATRLLNREAEKVREVALQLRNATDEQAKGSRVISHAITRITQDTQETSRVLQVQTKDSRTITDSMDSLASTAQNIEEVFQALTQASTRLQQSSVTLNQEIRAFRLPDGSFHES